MTQTAEHSSPRVLLLDENKGFGGAERHLLTLAGELHRLDLLVALGARNSSWLAENASGLPLHAVGFRNEVDMMSVYNIYRKLKQDSVNIIHCVAHRDLVAAALARQLPGSGKTVLLKAEHSFPDEKLSSLFRWAYTQVDAIVCVSEALKNSVVSAIEPQGPAIEVIWNGSELPSIETTLKPLGERALELGVLSPLRPGKGHSDLLQALAEVTNPPPYRLRFAGDGECRADLEAQAKRLGVGVEFLGHVDDPLEFLQELDLSIISSHRETFSLVAAESMACGRALIAAESDGVKEICEAYPARLYPKGDIKALAAALESFFADPDSLRQACFAEAENARTRFSLARMTGQYRELYQKLLS